MSKTKGSCRPSAYAFLVLIFGIALLVSSAGALTTLAEFEREQEEAFNRVDAQGGTYDPREMGLALLHALRIGKITMDDVPPEYRETIRLACGWDNVGREVLFALLAVVFFLGLLAAWRARRASQLSSETPPEVEEWEYPLEDGRDRGLADAQNVLQEQGCDNTTSQGRGLRMDILSGALLVAGGLLLAYDSANVWWDATPWPEWEPKVALVCSLFLLVGGFIWAIGVKMHGRGNPAMDTLLGTLLGLGGAFTTGLAWYWEWDSDASVLMWVSSFTLFAGFFIWAVGVKSNRE